MILVAACSFVAVILILNRNEPMLAGPGDIRHHDSRGKEQVPASTTVQPGTTVSVSRSRSLPADDDQQPQPADNTRRAARNILARTMAVMKANGSDKTEGWDIDEK